MSTERHDDTTIIYEHPLNERVRNFMRLEFLFDQGEFGVAGDSVWHSRTAVGALIDILQMLSRGDLRSEIQKELERIAASLEALGQRDGVDHARLKPILEEAEHILGRLREAPPGIPSHLRDNELLASVSQRMGILGGTCAFDVPGFNLWLNRPLTERRQDLEHWFEGFQYLREADRLILRLIRTSAAPRATRAEEGLYQATLDREVTFQLLRLHVPSALGCFPEISGSRHFCTVRFMEQPSAMERPRQITDDVEFELQQCAI